MFSPNFGTWVLMFLLVSSTFVHSSMSEIDAKKRYMREKVRKINRQDPVGFPGWDSRIANFWSSAVLGDLFWQNMHNFDLLFLQHDELKPLSKTFTDSLSELGNLNLEHLSEHYNGSALTLIESLSSLVILGNNTEFERAVRWLSENLSFDVDVRTNLFECNIRVLGGLVSAHILATDSRNRLVQGTYKNELLILAEDLGRRFLPAFDTPTGLPYAWINLKIYLRNIKHIASFVKYVALNMWFFLPNGSLVGPALVCSPMVTSSSPLRATGGLPSCSLQDPVGLVEVHYGVMENETTETSTSGCALRALRKLWSMRSSLNLLGTTLDVATGEWIEYSSGIGAGMFSLGFDLLMALGVDSFYEYLIKAHILLGRRSYGECFSQPILLYHEADMRTGKATYWQLTSLQAFWPGVQARDIAAANSSHREFVYVWEKFGVLPERYHIFVVFIGKKALIGSSYNYLDPWYIEVGKSMVDSLNLYAKVEGGFASIKDVTTMQLEDHQHSFFLAETCKYLYLLFDDSFWLIGIMFSQLRVTLFQSLVLGMTDFQKITFPPMGLLSSTRKMKFSFMQSEKQAARRSSAMSLQVCPATTLNSGRSSQQVESACHIPDAQSDHRCLTEDECGVDATTCRRRSCSMAGYCGLWLFI
ncbi:Alpha-mannosidase I MNS5 [Vitis vinifera]|uniref:alpha-1,2-Mannosidase n=1 Tax=Vitis vinifera TaxID=29760 RepID=A0A438EYH5_VITVI|nr:Alpha-mannosidase I MNS5 [Vitis vinifera]